MKDLRVIVATLVAVMSVATLSAQKLELTGRVIDENAQNIPYATVVLTTPEGQAAGGATSESGGFALYAPEGEYTLTISYIGYTTHTQQLKLTKNRSLGDITLKSDSEQIDEVVVTAQLIRREADRFVVDVANSPIAMGKDGEELLKSAPGVWIQDDKISINGASGSKVYLNDREVKLDDAQLMAYLRSLTANDIQRIEVVPQSGADYDASSSGGIIKITTKRRVDTGLMGSASLSLRATKGNHHLMPSVSLNYNRDKLNAYGRAWTGLNNQDYIMGEHTDYASLTKIDAASNQTDKTHWGGANIGMVYDINSKHSVGLEVQYNYFGGGSQTDTWTEHHMGGMTTRTDGNYTNKHYSQMTTATANYIYKLDNMGSVIKFIGDYTDSRTPNRNNYFDTTTIIEQPFRRDSTYRSNTYSHYQLGTATLALEKIISPKLILKAGAKYTYNTNSNDGLYEYLNGESWLKNEENSYNIGYTENIAAAYIIATSRMGRLSLVGGLRGEYTWFRSADGEVKQNYLDLFPNANVSYALTQDGAYSLIAQYSRTISRPSFWALSPNETKISEYMIQRGNPNLKPSYNNSLSLTGVLKYKYTITIGMQIMQNAIQQTTIVDKKNPELLILQTINYPTLNNFFVSANLPFQITKWWSANINITGMYMGQRIYPEEPLRRNFMGTGNCQMAFTLPLDFIIEASGRYAHGMVAGNTKIKDFGNLDISVKKHLIGKRLTLKLGVDNIIPMKQTITMEEPTFKRTMTVDQPWMRPAVNFSISYNFNSGKKFQAKSVESGSAEDRSRLGGNN